MANVSSIRSVIQIFKSYKISKQSPSPSSDCLMLYTILNVAHIFGHPNDQCRSHLAEY